MPLGVWPSHWQRQYFLSCWFLFPLTDQTVGPWKLLVILIMSYTEILLGNFLLLLEEPQFQENLEMDLELKSTSSVVETKSWNRYS